VIDYGKWKMNGQGVSKAQLDQVLPLPL
jgi:hypothetical protein